VRRLEQVDLRLYAIVDPEHTGGHGLVELTRAVARGGATLVQLRDKVNSTAEMIAQARALKAALAPLGVPLIINDRVEVARAVEADGVHLGQEDMSVEEARRLLARVIRVFRDRIGNFPTCGIAGITAQNAEAVIAAGADGVSVISALSYCPDPEAAARELRAVVDAAVKKYAPKVPAVGAHHHGTGVGA
jgi:thiamine-phosphate pyrophosphorylase